MVGEAPAERPAESRVKGLAFRSAMRALLNLRGEEVRDRALALMHTEIGQPLRYGAIVAPQWYAVALYREMWRGIRAATGEGPDVARLIGREATQSDLNLVHKLIMKMLSPQTIAAAGARLFSSFYEPGKAEIQSRPGFSHARYLQCPGFDRCMWMECLGASEIVLELAGAKNVRCRIVRGGHDGDDFAEVEAHWTP
jgi:hypothetical protein